MQVFVAQGKAHRADQARWNAIGQQTSAILLDGDLIRAISVRQNARNREK